MSYRTKRPATRKLLTFGVGVTLAITQLGAGCVPPETAVDRACEGDASREDGRCNGSDAAREGGDEK